MSKESTSTCFLKSNPGSGMVGSHFSTCCKVVGGKDNRHGCNRPVTTHAKRGGWCGNVCKICGKHEQDQGAILSPAALVVEPPATAKIGPASDAPAEVVETAPAADSAPLKPAKPTPAAPAGNGSALPLLDRINACTKDNPLTRAELAPKDRKLARDLAAAGVIIRDESAGRISYYPKGAA